MSRYFRLVIELDRGPERKNIRVYSRRFSRLRGALGELHRLAEFFSERCRWYVGEYRDGKWYTAHDEGWCGDQFNRM